MRVSVETANSVRVRVGACPAVFGRAPDDGEVLAWVVDLTAPPVHPDELFCWLTSEEQVRAQRYRIAKAREQFVIGRGLLRGMLGACLGARPDAVELTYLPSRKPVLCDSTPGIHFNVTHTDGIAVLAVARRRVGVDVEIVRPMRDADGLVGRYFSSAECAAYRGLSEDTKQAGFFRGWTSKEAVIKAAGATVACLADFDVELNPSRPPSVLNTRTELLAGSGWTLAEWAATGNVAVAVALEGKADLVIDKSI